MRELNNIKIIAVDHGYGNIKTANTVTPTGVTAYETEPIFSGNILEYGGCYYRIGEGYKEFINGIASQDKKVKEMDTFLGKLEQQHATLSEQKENDQQKFLEIRNGIDPENHDAVMAEREAIRPDGKVGLIQKLYAVYKDKYRSEIFDEANRQIDVELQEKPIQKQKHSIREQLKSPRQETPQAKKQKKEYER